MTSLPEPKHASPNSASAVQELLGGKYGEMSTLMNYTYQGTAPSSAPRET